MGTMLECPASGKGFDTGPALKVDSPNGDRTLALVYHHANIENGRLEIVVKDKV
jgi:alpha-galactosidase